jgi:dihydroneopterin aldolase
VIRLAQARRYNLQETLVHAIFERVAATRGVRALRVKSDKPDVYDNAKGVGVEIASFTGVAP